MANTILTADIITKEALRILHQKLNFIGNINRSYDKSFANTGAKIGDSLRVRLPNEYTVRTGAAISSQDSTETKVDLAMGTQKGVDTTFSSKELTLDLDNFSSNILEPAMAVLASAMEADALSMYKDVYQEVDSSGSALSFSGIMNARKKLVDALAPMDNNNCMCLDTQANVDVVDALKGLFQDSASISKQYKTGMLGQTAGFKFYENTLAPVHTAGSATALYVVDGAAQTGAALTVKTGTGTVKEGDVFTIAGVYRVHPETKATTVTLQEFAITADGAGGAGDFAISPAIITSGAKQNVTGSAADGAAINFHGTISTATNISLGFHKDAFAFVTADLMMPNGVDFSARNVYDGISMRIVRQYDINTDTFPCRLDVLYGYKTIRPQLAARIASN